MDPKNLAVLIKLKESMGASAPKSSMPSSNELSEESLLAIRESVKRRFEASADPQLAKTRRSLDQQRRECTSCKEVYSVEPEKLRPYWVCTHCRHLKKQKRREEAEARVAAQYAKASGTKVQQIERSIAALKSRIAEGSELNQRGLHIQLADLEKRLALERVHTISKLSSIRARQLPGSYGSSKK